MCVWQIRWESLICVRQNLLFASERTLLRNAIIMAKRVLGLLKAVGEPDISWCKLMQFDLDDLQAMSIHQYIAPKLH